MVPLLGGSNVSGHIVRVVLVSGWSYCQGGPIFRVVLFLGWSYCRGGLIVMVVLFSR